MVKIKIRANEYKILSKEESIEVYSNSDEIDKIENSENIRVVIYVYTDDEGKPVTVQNNLFDFSDCDDWNQKVANADFFTEDDFDDWEDLLEVFNEGVKLVATWDGEQFEFYKLIDAIFSPVASLFYYYRKNIPFGENVINALLSVSNEIEGNFINWGSGSIHHLGANDDVVLDSARYTSRSGNTYLDFKNNKINLYGNDNSSVCYEENIQRLNSIMESNQA